MTNLRSIKRRSGQRTCEGKKTGLHRKKHSLTYLQ